MPKKVYQISNNLEYTSVNQLISALSRLDTHAWERLSFL